MSQHKMFMNIAKEIASQTKCVSKKVGCIIVKDGRILSTGYNGTPSKYINCSEYWNNEYTKDHHTWSNIYEIHAEMNAIIWSARQGISIDNSVLYCTYEPCVQCTKNIVASGIKEIYYGIDYNSKDEKETTGNICRELGIKKVKV